MARRHAAVDHRQALLAAIARREWLLQMLALGAAAGCRRGYDPAYARGNMLVMAYPESGSLGYDDLAAQSLYLPRLVERDESGSLHPRLAQSWVPSADYRECTYHLRTDVRWSDGVPVTAEDVKFTLTLLNHPAVHYSSVDEATIIDEYTLSVRRKGGAGPEAIGWLYQLPKHVLEKLDPKAFWEWDYWYRPTVSAGPYRFVRYEPNTLMEFEANPTYVRSRPRIPRVVLKFVGEEAGLIELMSGNVDIVHPAIFDPAQVPVLAGNPRFGVHWTMSSTGGWAIFWKCDHPLFRDPRVRRALTLAIDRRALLGVLNLPDDLPITDGVFTERQFLRRELPEPVPYDPAQAGVLLDAAGWRGRDGDGVRERAGQPFRFSAITRTQGLDRVAFHVQAQLRRMGVQMEIQVQDIGVMWDRFLSGDFEAAFHNHQPFPGGQRRDFGRGNRHGYHNPEMVRLTEQAVATADPDERDGIYSAITEILRDDLPLTRLVPTTMTSAAHRRVVAPRPSMLAWPDRFMEDLWLEAGL